MRADQQRDASFDRLAVQPDWSLPFSFTAAFDRAATEPTALTLHVVLKHADLMKRSREFSIQISDIFRSAPV
jgi:hypothetical protein